MMGRGGLCLGREQYGSGMSGIGLLDGVQSWWEICGSVRGMDMCDFECIKSCIGSIPVFYLYARTHCRRVLITPPPRPLHQAPTTQSDT